MGSPLRYPIEGDPTVVTWNPRGRPTGTEIFELERPVEATKNQCSKNQCLQQSKKPVIS